MATCEIRRYIYDAGIDDTEWAACRGEAAHTLTYIPPWERAEVEAARTTAGYVRHLRICSECARTLRGMIAEDEELARWVAVDDSPEPWEEDA